MLNLSWKLFLQIFQNLNITTHEFKFVLRTYSTAGYFEELMRLHFMADVIIFIFSTQFEKRKRFAHFVRLIFLLTCKKKFQWQLLQAKKFIAKTVALNYISRKVCRITHHTQIFTVTATTNATWENRKVRNIITWYRAIAYLGRSIFEYYLKSMDLFQITVYQISNITGSKSLQKQNRIK